MRRGFVLCSYSICVVTNCSGCAAAAGEFSPPLRGGTSPSDSLGCDLFEVLIGSIVATVVDGIDAAASAA